MIRSRSTGWSPCSLENMRGSIFRTVSFEPAIPNLSRQTSKEMASVTSVRLGLASNWVNVPIAPFIARTNLVNETYQCAGLKALSNSSSLGRCLDQPAEITYALARPDRNHICLKVTSIFPCRSADTREHLLRMTAMLKLAIPQKMCCQLEGFEILFPASSHHSPNSGMHAGYGCPKSGYLSRGCLQ